MPVAPEINKGKGYAAPNNKKTATGGVDYATLIAKLLGNTSAPIDMAALTNTASAQAAQDIASTIGAYHTEQERLRQAAQGRAQLINQAAAAAGKYVTGVGDATAASYNQAAQNEAMFAKGYSNQLGATANDEADKINAQLGALNTDQRAPFQGEGLANVLYGLGGAIPANNLVETGAAYAAAQRQLPASFLGYGQQQAIGALGAGDKDAAAYNPEILKAISSQPKLLQEYLTSLVGNATKLAGVQNQERTFQLNTVKAVSAMQSAQQRIQLQEKAINDRWNISQRTLADREQHDKDMAALNKIKEDNLTTWRKIQADLSAQRNAISQQNANTASTNAATSAANANRPQIIGSDKAGRFILQPTKNGYQVVPVLKPVPGSKTGGKFSNSLVSGVAGDLQSWHTGVTGTSNGVPVVDKKSQLNWNQALERAITRGPNTRAWMNRALKLVTAEYGPPEPLARDFVKVGLGNGTDLPTHIRNIMELSYVSPTQVPVPYEYIFKALADAYSTPDHVVTAQTVKALFSAMSSGQTVAEQLGG